MDTLHSKPEATDPKVKAKLGRLLWLADKMPLLSQTELGEQIAKLF